MNTSIFKNGMLMCTENNIEQVKHYSQLLTLFLNETKFLVEAYILDFFVEDLWYRLPLSWRDIVNEFNSTDLEVFLNCEKLPNQNKPWPLSLLAFRASCIALSLPRQSISSLSIVNEFLQTSYGNNRKLGIEYSWGPLSEEFEVKSGQHIHLPSLFRKHVKPKKQHEIYRMSQVTNFVMKYFEENNIIDIGSGQGHLSRLLALHYNFQVATVEADALNVSGASKFDQEAAICINRKSGNTSNNKFVEHIPHHQAGSIISSSCENYLDQTIKRAWGNDKSEIPLIKRFALVGLHTCGSLAETMLKCFLTCQNSRILFSVGCCYMKPAEDLNNHIGYPLSSFVKTLPFHSLSYEAKELSCHASEMYCQRLLADSPLLKIHCYRATLEKCIVNHYPTARHLGLRGVKHAESMSFADYAERALKKTSLSIPREYYSLPVVSSCLKEWPKVLIFFILRLHTAQVIESLLLVDRLLYLYESGHPGCIIPIFDPTISPRNHLLLSAKCDE